MKTYRRLMILSMLFVLLPLAGCAQPAAPGTKPGSGWQHEVRLAQRMLLPMAIDVHDVSSMTVDCRVAAVEPNGLRRVQVTLRDVKAQMALMREYSYNMGQKPEPNVDANLAYYRGLFSSLEGQKFAALVAPDGAVTRLESLSPRLQAAAAARISDSQGGDQLAAFVREYNLRDYVSPNLGPLPTLAPGVTWEQLDVIAVPLAAPVQIRKLYTVERMQDPNVPSAAVVNVIIDQVDPLKPLPHQMQKVDAEIVKVEGKGKALVDVKGGFIREVQEDYRIQFRTASAGRSGNPENLNKLYYIIRKTIKRK